MLQKLDRPLAPAAILALVAVLFVVLRLAAAGGGDIGSFVYAGQQFTAPQAGVPVQPGPGYDGQFAYRLALDPAELGDVSDGIRLDTPLRLERIAYPAFAWVVAGGQDSVVPTSLVVVNLLALAGLAYLGGLLARRTGRHALWGLLLAGYWGYLFSLGRDLHEIVTGFFVLAGLLAYRDRRGLLAGGLLGVAVLARETALLVVVAIAAVRLWDLLRLRQRPQALELAWLLPVVVFVGWQAVCWAASGEVPALAGGPAQVGPPVVSLIDAVLNTVGDLGSGKRAASALLLVQLAAMVVVVVLAGLRMRESAIPREERLAWLLALLLTLSLSRHYWTGPADLRALSDLYLLSAVLLLARPTSEAPTRRRARSSVAWLSDARLSDARVLHYAAVPAALTFAATYLARVVEL